MKFYLPPSEKLYSYENDFDSLFLNDKYEELKPNHRSIYLYLLGKMHSIPREQIENFCDEERRIFFPYTIKEISKTINVHENTVRKTLKKLEEFDLVERIGKRLYILKPDITNTKTWGNLYE